MKSKNLKIMAAVALPLALAAGIAQAAPRYTAWSVAAPVVEVNSTAPDGCPIESRDGLSLYIASSRTGTLGGNDIWAADRASKSEPFGEPQNLGAPVNTAANDFCPTPIYGNYLLFVSEVPGPGDLRRRARPWRYLHRPPQRGLRLGRAEAPRLHRERNRSEQRGRRVQPLARHDPGRHVPLLLEHRQREPRHLCQQAARQRRVRSAVPGHRAQYGVRRSHAEREERRPRGRVQLDAPGGCEGQSRHSAASTSTRQSARARRSRSRHPSTSVRTSTRRVAKPARRCPGTTSACISGATARSSRPRERR